LHHSGALRETHTPSDGTIPLKPPAPLYAYRYSSTYEEKLMSNCPDPYARYHARYSNQTYARIQRSIIADLYGPADQPAWETRLWQRLGEPIPNLLLNLVTDAALEICGAAARNGALIRLATTAATHAVSTASIQAIVEHLARFEESERTHSQDFAATAHALLVTRPARSASAEAMSYSSLIHSVQAQAAYDLFGAAHYLLHAAEILLTQEDELYLREKLARGQRCLEHALKTLDYKTP
jgi:hypothetical protein